MVKLKYVKLIQICCISVHLNELSEREIKEIIPLTKLRRKKCLGINLPKASLIAQLVKNKTKQNKPACNAGDPGSIPGLGWSAGEGIGYPTPVFLGLPCVSAGKESACNAGDLGLIPGLGRSPGEGKGYLLQYCSLEKSTDCIVHGVAKSWTRLSDLHLRFVSRE